MMTVAALDARQRNADRRAADLKPAVAMVATDVWAVESARRDVTYIVRASVDGLTCSCLAGDQGLPCYHKSRVLDVAATPEPPTPAAPAVAASEPDSTVDHGGRCRRCLGTGIDCRVGRACRSCHGTGAFVDHVALTWRQCGACGAKANKRAACAVCAGLGRVAA